MASVCLALFAVRRASGVAGLKVSDVPAFGSKGVVGLEVRCQKNDQFGVGQRAHVVATPSRRGACPVQFTAGWLGPRDWLSRRRDYAGRMSPAPDGEPLFAGLARSRFGLGMAPSGVSASWAKGFDGRNLSPRKGGARLYVVNGMAREAT